MLSPPRAPYPYSSILELEIEEIDWQRWQKLVNTVADMFNAPATFINQANSKGIEVIIASQKPETHYQAGSIDLNSNIYCHQVVKNSAKLYVRDAKLDPQWSDNPEYTEDNYVSYLGLPISWPDGSIFGTLCVLDTKVTHYSQTYINALAVIKEVIDSDLRHLYKENQLLTLSYTDPLTQIYNRRGFEDLLISTQDLAQRLNRQLILLYFDLDQFKQANDNYGHEIGDEILKTFAKMLKINSRSCDLVARWGGDEFLVLIHAENEHCVELFNHRMAQKLSTCSLSQDIQYSFGYAVLKPGDKTKLDTLLKTADRCMYLNKLAKKNLSSN
ncbi:sensor domain-containing diguanylate cyclase [Shewanella violacea]|uniref:diguanylate cyclase n=1 Tax=Shewanella violacea (strain JCM 10179 / CIP 106290 / LMG 19151 / DSS12) TaxID=637905 RepID=D4ZAD5_SHEVD|nr:GGDEF domain-containing protein [Shewanella violacea]BAJ02980.1 GAF/GGDEF domain protein [Shewanella violacea DSS12]